MKLEQVKDSYGQTVLCYRCAERINLSDSFADLEGEAFQAFYCIDCVKELELERKMNDRVNGFRNGETNSVYLWIVSDQKRFKETKRLAENLDLSKYDEDLGEADRKYLAFLDALQERFESKAPEETSDIYNELMYKAISNIAWNEITETLLERFDEQ